jgi:hypothetical protein
MVSKTLSGLHRVKTIFIIRQGITTPCHCCRLDAECPPKAIWEAETLGGGVSGKSLGQWGVPLEGILGPFLFSWP